MINKALFTSEKQDWTTPLDLYEKLDDEFNFDFDPCIVDNKATMDTNGLHIEWGKSNFVNPPYSDISKWVAKAYQEYLKDKKVVMLIPSRTDTKWWHKYIVRATEIRFIEGRLTFGNDLYWQWVWEQPTINGKPNSLYKKYGKKNSAPFPSAIIIFNPQNKKEKEYDSDRLKHNGLFDEETNK